MTSAIDTTAATNFSSLVSSSQSATQATEAQMANSVATGADASAASSVSANYNTFLKILTTQLQNQDPTSPEDTDQFTQELVEFSGVEQQLNTNSLLQQLVTAQASGVKSLLNYVGSYVETPTTTNQMLLQGGNAYMTYTLPSAASNVSVNVMDSSNNVVATLTGTGNNGVNQFAWNGQNTDGTQLADGVYTFKVTATDSSGNTVTPTAYDLVGQVTGVQTADSSGNDLMLGPNMTINDANVAAVFAPGSWGTGTVTNNSASAGSS